MMQLPPHMRRAYVVFFVALGLFFIPIGLWLWFVTGLSAGFNGYWIDSFQTDHVFGMALMVAGLSCIMLAPWIMRSKRLLVLLIGLLVVTGLYFLFG